MSIINEALKKAQEANKQRVNVAADQVPEPSAGAPSNTQVSSLPAVSRQGFKRPAKIRRFLPVLMVVVIISGTLLFFKSFFKKVSKVEPIKEETRQASAPVSPSKNAPDLPTLNLSGIVYDNERPYAIVNNKVLSKGDMIEGATLIEINRASVKFVFNDKEFELSSE